VPSAILVDDGSWLRQHLCGRLERHPEIVVVGEADKVQSAAELVAVARPKDFSFSHLRPP
jgi:hypothetical protein